MPAVQVKRIDGLVSAGFARSRDEFIRTWAELGIAASTLQQLALGPNPPKGLVKMRVNLTMAGEGDGT